MRGRQTSNPSSSCFGARLCASHQTHISSFNPQNSTSFIYILQMMALRLREVKELAQGHPAGKWQRQDLQPSLSINKALQAPLSACPHRVFQKWVTEEESVQSHLALSPSQSGQGHTAQVQNLLSHLLT